MEPRDPDPAVVGDPGISTLGEVLDPVTARTYLGQALSDHGQTIEDIRFQILKHHPGKRCTLNIGVRTPDGWRALIGKVYAEDRSDASERSARWLAQFHAMAPRSGAVLDP